MKEVLQGFGVILLGILFLLFGMIPLFMIVLFLSVKAFEVYGTFLSSFLLSTAIYFSV